MIGRLRLSHLERYVYGIDGMKLSVDGSALIHALQWSGFHEESYYKKVADQKHILSQYLSIETETTVLEVGCGGLTVGSWLIDILSPYSYTCIDVAPWAPKLVLEAGVRTDTVRTDTAMGYLNTMVTDFTHKHAHIEGSALCEWKAANRGKVDLVFSFTAIDYLPCNNAYTCMDNTYEALKPGGRMLIAVPVEEHAIIAVSTHIREPLVIQYPSRVCNTRDAIQRWAHSHGVSISVGPLHTSDYPSPPRQEMWLLEHEATVSAGAVRQGQ
jgi:SAM-dependent methyltransferase